MENQRVGGKSLGSRWVQDFRKGKSMACRLVRIYEMWGVWNSVGVDGRSTGLDMKSLMPT